MSLDYGSLNSNECGLCKSKTRDMASLSLVQMKDKMVLSRLKLKQKRFKPLKQSMFTFTTKMF